MTELILTSDGSHTLFVPELDEHYHSVHGAVQESNHVFISNGYNYCKADPLRVFEVGFGTGLNALLTAFRSFNNKRKVIYTTIEKHPLNSGIINSLNYQSFAGNNGKELFNAIHAAPWDKFSIIHDFFELKKINGDLMSDPLTGSFNLIYFDAFGPDKQPGIWSRDVFKKIAGITEKGGLLTTYSAKGEIKRILTENDFIVELLPGPPGKRQMIRAFKKK
jgi:tRNA U34 5-methylaminomethyl-2-thiouridine-forming methyltransferase MnmC